MRLKVTAPAAALAAVAALAFAAPSQAALTSPSECDLVAAPNGSDSAAGTEAAPLRTSDAAIQRLAAGQTLCFRSGTYSTARGLSIKAPGAFVTSYPGETATLLGSLRIERPATGTTVENLVLNGKNPDNYFNPLIYADGAVLRDNEITNEHTTNCVHLAHYYDEPAPNGVVIENNNIHDCGTLPANNHEHGIYIAAARNLIIRNNEIWNNADRGVQLYTDVRGAQIYGNVINNNGTGVIFGGNDEMAASDNVVENNVITNSNVRFNVEYSFDPAGPQGSGNLVRHNCIYGAQGWYGAGENVAAISDEVGFTATDNVIADPQFADPAHGDFTMAPGSPCAGVLGGIPTPIGQISLDADKRAVPKGSSTRLRGTLPDGVTGKVWILRSQRGNWKQVKGVKVHGLKFTVKTRIHDRTRFKARAVGARDSRAVRVHARSTRKR